MWFPSLLPFPQWSGRHPTRHRNSAPPRFVPRLELLEDRIVPSTLTVLNNFDSGVGSLRDTIAAATSGDTIDFASALKNKTITLTSGELAVTKSLDIEGLGAKNLTISGNHTSRVFDISGGVSVTIAGLTIADGLAVGDLGGGGILNHGSALTLSSDVLSHNQALGFDGANTFVAGGALSNQAGSTLTVAHSTFTDN